MYDVYYIYVFGSGFFVYGSIIEGCDGGGC